MTKDILRCYDDNSQIEFADAGDAGGLPVFGMHGFMDSLETIITAAAAAAARHRLRLIAANRPGVGASRSPKRWTKADRAKDVLHLADALGIERFGIFGTSGGAADALSVLHAAPHRVKAAAIISGFGPVGRRDFLEHTRRPLQILLPIARRLPPALAKGFLHFQFKIQCRDKAGLLTRCSRILSPDDVRILQTRKEVQDILWTSHEEIFERGEGAHALYEEVLRLQRWGFDPSDLSTAVPVKVWSGDEDTIVTPAMTMKLARELPPTNNGALRPEMRPGGHLMIIKDNNIDDVCQWLRTTLEKAL
jgi:pimeloyl-ACP methyl ester carboxylesterase